MNAEVALSCRLVAAAKQTLKTGKAEFTALPHEKNVSFRFCRRTSALGSVPEFTLGSPKEWLTKLLEDSAQDVFIVMPYAVKDMEKLGYLNTSHATIFVQYKNEGVTRFLSQWIFNEEDKSWSVVYHEDPMEDAPAEPPAFRDNSRQFAAVLTNMCKFSHHIGYDGFASMFAMGAAMLSGEPIPPEVDTSAIPPMSEHRLRIYLACDISDMFGGKGTWTDAPRAKAAEMGLTDDYNKLTAALYGQNRLALMYAVNEE